MSSLKLSRRLLYSVRFVFGSTFSLQRGRAFVVGITNLSKQAVCVKAKAPADQRVSEENVRRIQEIFERSPRRSGRRASRELGIPQPTNCLACVEAPFTVQAIKTYEVSPSFCITLYVTYTTYIFYYSVTRVPCMSAQIYLLHLHL